MQARAPHSQSEAARKTASAEKPALTKRMPQKRCAANSGMLIPSRSSAAIPSGIRPSPQGLSMGGVQLSATVTSNPRRRRASAAASPAGTTSNHEHVIFTSAQSVHHSSATSSEQKPGPIAASRPKVPGAGRRFFMTSSSTTNTDADERFPTRRRQSHEAASSSVLETQRRRGRLQHLRTARVQHPAANIAALTAKIREKAVDVISQLPLDQIRHFRRRARSGSRSPKSPSPSSLRSRDRRRACRQDPRPLGGFIPSALSPATTTAAAPSPNNPAEIMLATDRSSRCRVREHSSTASSTATWSG